MIQFGLRLHDAEKPPMEQVLPLVRQKGFTCAHLALSKAMKEYPCTPSALTPGYALYLRRLFDKNGIDIAVPGNYLNLAHPDEGALAAIQEKILCPHPLCQPAGLRHGGHGNRRGQGRYGLHPDHALCQAGKALHLRHPGKHHTG